MIFGHFGGPDAHFGGLEINLEDFATFVIFWGAPGATAAPTVNTLFGVPHNEGAVFTLVLGQGMFDQWMQVVELHVGGILEFVNVKMPEPLA